MQLVLGVAALGNAVLARGVLLLERGARLPTGGAEEASRLHLERIHRRDGGSCGMVKPAPVEDVSVPRGVLATSPYCWLHDAPRALLRRRRRRWERRAWPWLLGRASPVTRGVGFEDGHQSGHQVIPCRICQPRLTRYRANSSMRGGLLGSVRPHLLGSERSCRRRTRGNVDAEEAAQQTYALLVMLVRCDPAFRQRPAQHPKSLELVRAHRSRGRPRPLDTAARRGDASTTEQSANFDFCELFRFARSTILSGL